MQKEAYPNIAERGIVSYYGIERYKNRLELTSYIYNAEKELHRILKPDGILWLRWCTMTKMTEQDTLEIFKTRWTHCTTHQIESSRRSTGKTNSYWFMLMKKPELSYKLTDFSKIDYPAN